MRQSQITDILDAARLLEANGVEFTKEQIQHLIGVCAAGMLVDLAIAQQQVNSALADWQPTTPAN
jgi:hypothetical protein